MVKLPDTLRSTAVDLWSDGRGWILIAIAAGWFLSHGVRTAYPALVPFFREDLGISLSIAGLLLSVLWASYALGQLPGGVLGDRIGEGRILVYSTAVSAGAVFLAVLSVTVWTLFAATILFGFATALYGPTRFTIFTDIYTKRSGSAIGLTMAAGSAGDAILPLLAVLLATALVWQFSFGLFVPLFVGATVLLWYTVPSRTSSASSGVDIIDRETVQRVRRSISVAPIPSVVTIQILVAFVFQGFVSFYPTYLIDAKGLSAPMAASLYALVFVAGGLVQPLAGMGNDQLGSRRTIIALLCFVSIGLWMLPFLHSMLSLIAITICLGSLMGPTVITQTYLANNLPDDMKGTGLGTIRTLFLVLAASSPFVVGTLGDFDLFDEAFLLLGGLATIGLFLSVLRFE